MNISAPAATVRYGPAAIALHWLTAILIVANLALGLSMVPLPFSPRKLQWYLWHKWIGITVFLLAWLRLAWRWGHPPPPPLPAPPWQLRAAAAVHGALYVLLVAVPVSGWVYSSATGIQVVYLGLLPLPDLVEKDRALASVLRIVHVSLVSTLALLVLVHLAAALKHHFLDRDGVLARMVPGIRPKGSTP
jgi:cytochrome b561